MVLHRVAHAQDGPVEQAVREHPHHEELHGPRERRLRVGRWRQEIGDVEGVGEIEEEHERQADRQVDRDARGPAAPLEREPPAEPQDHRRGQRPRVGERHLHQQRRPPRQRGAAGHGVTQVLLSGAEEPVARPYGEDQAPADRIRGRPSHGVQKMPAYFRRR